MHLKRLQRVNDHVNSKVLSGRCCCRSARRPIPECECEISPHIHLPALNCQAVLHAIMKIHLAIYVGCRETRFQPYRTEAVNRLLTRCRSYSSAHAVDSPSAGRSTDGIFRHPRMFHGGSSLVSQLLDSRRRSYDPRVEKVPRRKRSGQSGL